MKPVRVELYPTKTNYDRNYVDYNVIPKIVRLYDHIYKQSTVNKDFNGVFALVGDKRTRFLVEDYRIKYIEEG